MNENCTYALKFECPVYVIILSYNFDDDLTDGYFFKAVATRYIQLGLASQLSKITSPLGYGVVASTLTVVT